MKALTPCDLPIIDVSCLWGDASEKALVKLGEEVSRACRSAGFFYISNHGIRVLLQKHLRLIGASTRFQSKKSSGSSSTAGTAAIRPSPARR